MLIYVGHSAKHEWKCHTLKEVLNCFYNLTVIITTRRSPLSTFNIVSFVISPHPPNRFCAWVSLAVIRENKLSGYQVLFQGFHHSCSAIRNRVALELCSFVVQRNLREIQKSMRQKWNLHQDAFCLAGCCKWGANQYQSDSSENEMTPVAQLCRMDLFTSLCVCEQ